MKLNCSPSKVAFLDFETQSMHDLKKSTHTRYAKDPSTKILTCVVKVGNDLFRMGPYLTETDKDVLRNIAKEYTLVAHNAPFDAAIWEAAGLGPVEWFDTLPCARAAGLPGALDKLSKSLGGRGKDKNGERLIDMLCILKPGKKPPAIGPAHGMLMDYNVQDVEELEYIYGKVCKFGEPDVMQVDRIINDRGIPMDRQVLEKLRGLFEINAREQKEVFDDVTCGVNPKSPKQVVEWMQSIGFDTAKVDKATVLSMFSKPDEFFVGEGDMGDALDVLREALMARKDAVSVGRSKVDTALQYLDPDDRIRDQVVYFGAHTGRWSGRKLQPHNMPSNVGGNVDIKSVPLEYEAMKAEAERASKDTKSDVPVSYMLSTAIRTAIRADNLLVVDYAAVEGRGLAWVSDEETMLKLYSDPKRSLYLDMGEKLFGRVLDKKKEFVEYQLCKAIILGCGYQMSGAKFNITLATRNIDTRPLQAAGLTAQDCVKLYRTTYGKIPAVWKAYHEAVHSAVNGDPTYAGRVEFKMVDGNLHAVLPSGRPIVYRNARIEMQVPGYCKMYNMPEIPVPVVIYDGPRSRGFLYGGKICENVVQALCRDLLAKALVHCEQVGLKPCLHVHDEILCEAPQSRFKEMMQIMSDPPAWAAGFPLQVEGYSGPVWTKNPKGYTEGVALLGRML